MPLSSWNSLQKGNTNSQRYHEGVLGLNYAYKVLWDCEQYQLYKSFIASLALISLLVAPFHCSEPKVSKREEE